MKNIVSQLNSGVIYHILKNYDDFFLVVPNNSVAEKLKNEIELISSYLNISEKAQILYENDYDSFQNFDYEKFIEENSVLKKITETKVLPVISIGNLFKIFNTPEVKDIKIKTGSEIDLIEFRENLLRKGYKHQIPVEEKGTFYIKGGIVDIFVPYYDKPVRIELFGDEVESIRFFDADFQISLNNIDSFIITDIVSLSFEEKKINEFKEYVKKKFEKEEISYKEMEKLFDITENKFFESDLIGYLPFFYGKKVSFLNLIKGKKKNIFLYDIEKIYDILESFKKNDSVYFDKKSFKSFISGKYKDFFNIFYITPNEGFIDYHKPGYLTYYENKKLNTEIDVLFKIVPQEPKTYSRLVYLVDKSLKEGKKVVFFYKSEEKRQKISKILNNYNLVSRNIVWVEGFLKEAFLGDEEVFLSDYSVLGEYLPPVKNRKISRNTIFSFSDLNKGDFVVHSSYGIGRYEGMVQRDLGGKIDFMEISYAGKDKLYLPVYNMGLLHKHSSSDANVKLDRFGSRAWENRKKRIKKSIEKIAKELIELYGARITAKGFSFSANDELYEAFCDEFPYILTEDQSSAVNDIIKDMEDEKPMDRLICGDVGFGKTEVAMRAAFKAVVDNKQVALLTPTTVLAFQHYITFRERFKNFPVNIEYISSFKSLRDKRKIYENLEKGRIDIIIGTHAILNKSVKFKSLGLLIIDEEHKFGVKDKEKLRKLKLNIDTLAMTATPIPRTLNFSLSGIRDLSIINTPPKDRKSVKTVVLRKNSEKIKNAILYEISRGGQVFYIHNRIDTLYKEAEYILNLVPDIKTAIAHAKLPKRELEKIMLDFYNGKTDLLVTTNIIESGIDIPNANTIIINRADSFGLASLYQLRGRVGRASRQGFCLLLLPDKEITSVAKKRLSVISRYTDLGSGFQIALQDMEIRGAGTLLGFAQKGHVDEIGYETYMSFLKEALADIKGEKKKIKNNPELNTEFTALISSDYVDDELTRLSFYKRFSLVETEDEINDVAEELRDRYGKFPYETVNFINLIKIKTKARKYGIEKLNISKDSVYMFVGENENLNLKKLILYVTEKGNVKIGTNNDIFLKRKFENLKEVFETLSDFFNDVFTLN